MELKLGSVVTIRNVTTRESALFTIQEMIDYQGCAVVAGVTQEHGIRVARGLIHVAQRQGFFVWLPDEQAERVVALSEAMHGKPLVIIDRALAGDIRGMTVVPLDIGYPILNAGDVMELGGLPRARDAQFAKGRKMIDAYCRWRAAGYTRATLPRYLEIARVPLGRNA